jgi:hypothetical protein
MAKRIFIERTFLPAALVVLSAAVFGAAQQPSGNKHNSRPESVPSATNSSATSETDKTSPRYYYEFTQPEFYVRHIVVEHDATGRGRVSFERRNEETPIVESLELSPAALSRISGLWQALRFLDSDEVYQTDRDFSHLGTLRLKMEQDSRKRTAQFNWTRNKDASSLVEEYRRVADQALLVFDISVARESQPLNAPKLMDHLESLLKRNGLSDPNQLVTLLKEISTDEHVPLIARNHALRLLKKIQK